MPTLMPILRHCNQFLGHQTHLVSERQNTQVLCLVLSLRHTESSIQVQRIFGPHRLMPTLGGGTQVLCLVLSLRHTESSIQVQRIFGPHHPIQTLMSVPTIGSERHQAHSVIHYLHAHTHTRIHTTTKSRSQGPPCITFSSCPQLRQSDVKSIKKHRSSSIVPSLSRTHTRTANADSRIGKTSKPGSLCLHTHATHT